MSNNFEPADIREQQRLHDIWLAVHTPQWVLEAEAEDNDWIPEDELAADAWWKSQWSSEVPF